VHRAGDAAKAVKDQVVELGVRDELVRHVVAVRLEGRPVPGIDVPLRVVWGVDLDVVAAELDEPVDDVLTENAGDVANEVVRGRIGVGRVLGVPVARRAGRCRARPSGHRGS
jgi:hypothetical protein